MKKSYVSVLVLGMVALVLVISLGRSVPANPVATTAPTDPMIQRQNELLPDISLFATALPPTRENVSHFFSQEDLPALLAFLSDPEHHNSWSDVIWIIPYFSNETTREEIVPAYLDFIRRKDSWESWASEEFNAKIYAAELLGYMGGEAAEEFLRGAISREGARDAASKWLGSDLPGVWGTGADPVVDIQNSVALGLVFTQKPGNVEAIERLHAELLPLSKPIYAKKKKTALSKNEKRTLRLFHGMVEALVTRDLIEEIGFDDFQPLIFDTLKRWRLTQKFVAKYGMELPGEDEV